MRHALPLLVLVSATTATFATEPFPKEAELLKDVKVAEGFEATLFSAPPQSNYPVFVSAAPDGTLYVSSDGNGSLDRKPNRGRILRLRDTDGDGRADEMKEFVSNVDSPRGLVVDGNIVYCVHPPHLSAFIDKDGDGVADEEKVLVKNLAFTFKDRPADHTTNGIELGIDGWLYIAGGDFGFLEAEGTDGRKLQLRGGGVFRVRPDGTNLQLFARGTRNILEAAVSPLCDIFTRDNTNDGGGWDIRFHHFTGFEDHGYPRLFKSFGDEIIQPLADYGGGSGMGACWIDEPGWPAAWNNLPYTADWGKGPVFRHTVKPKGATFVESEKPAELVKMTRSTDIDVDAQGYAYVSSWKGATFTWEGPNVGYIVRLAPKGLKPAPVPDFAKASEADLVKLLESPSNRTRLEAQRTLLRNLRAATAGGKPPTNRAAALLSALASDASKPQVSRVAAIFALTQAYPINPLALVTPVVGDSPWILRAEGEMAGNALVLDLATRSLTSPDARTRKEAIIALARLHGLTGVWADGGTPVPQKLIEQDLAKHAASIAPLLGDPDPIVAHTAMQVLRQFAASEPCFAILDNPASPTPLRSGALMALRGIHDAKTVAGLLARLGKTKDATQRQGLLTALCRLYFTEGKWKGDSWGTRPDTRGPNYQPEEWSETPKIAEVLKSVLNTADNDEAAFLAKEFSRHRIKLNDALAKLISIADKDPSLAPLVARQLADADSIPANAVPILLRLSADPAAPEDALVATTQALAKTDSAESARAILEILGRLGGDSRNKARDAFFNSRLLENQHQLLEATAEKADGKAARWADAGLLKLASRKVGAPEPREMAAKALEAGWAKPKRRAQIIKAATDAEDKSRATQIAAALTDPDKDVVDAAKDAVKKLKLDPAKLLAAAKPAGPLISTLKVDDAIAQITAAKGDFARGEQLFTQAGCVACHTVKASEAPKGPFLGNIATTYKRKELAEAILQPNKTIAQGFVTNVFTMRDGTVQMGFVTQEGADKIVIRNIAAQEISLDPKNIAKRDKNDKSLMPEGLANPFTVQDLASLIDYLEALAKKQ
jgi:putative membrane-bound dehydrogenase-like protein